MNIFDIKSEKIDEMLHTLGTASILSQANAEMTVNDADKIRAQYLRDNYYYINKKNTKLK